MDLGCFMSFASGILWLDFHKMCSQQRSCRALKEYEYPNSLTILMEKDEILESFHSLRYWGATVAFQGNV